ncbi:MAG: ATP-binding protein, partial [bacterium]
LALFWAWAAHRLRNLIQTPLEEKWITDWYDSDKLVNNIVQNLATTFGRKEAMETIAQGLKNSIRIKFARIMLLDKEINSYVLQDKAEGEDDLAANQPLIEYLNKEGNLAHYANLRLQLKSATKEYPYLRNTLLLPIFSTDILEGLILLGPKISEDPYNDKDLMLFRTIITQATMVLDRIKPYEKIKADFDANQKKLYDTERLLARSERIASLANLIREYNHEIKTPLTVMRSELALLPKDLKLDEFKKTMTDAIRRADDIVESTLRLSEPKKRQEIELNLNEIIESVLKMLPPSGVHVDKQLGKIPVVKGDNDDLQTVFINLFKNANEAMERGGDLKIKTYVDKENNVIVEVADTGVGIAPENMEKIYEPFFSTHVTKGRGLGLSIVFRIVREHNGQVTVDSKVGQGTTFRLTFKST